MEAHSLRKLLVAWWDEHGRHDIPWKQASASAQIDPYGIWIAEVMLQQTQLQVALPYWQRWMQALPTLDALAAADEQQVLVYLFEAFDENWKGSDHPLEPEKHWGIYRADRQPKLVLSA